uniref:Acetolactate synthase n=1 Tax=Steinernema glaseri TaxID=37863 RepID=A0A1I8ABF8_9BILA
MVSPPAGGHSMQRRMEPMEAPAQDSPDREGKPDALPAPQNDGRTQRAVLRSKADHETPAIDASTTRHAVPAPHNPVITLETSNMCVAAEIAAKALNHAVFQARHHFFKGAELFVAKHGRQFLLQIQGDRHDAIMHLLTLLGQAQQIAAHIVFIITTSNQLGGCQTGNRTADLGLVHAGALSQTARGQGPGWFFPTRFPRR